MMITLVKSGDFYEAFDAEAVLLSKALKITLTKDRSGRPMAGIPYHALARDIDDLKTQGIICRVLEGGQP